MRDLRELATWFDEQPNAHDPLVPSSLPDPSFVSDGRTMISFSTNNYLALATSPRLKAAAHSALISVTAPLRLYCGMMLRQLALAQTLPRGSSAAQKTRPRASSCAMM